MLGGRSKREARKNINADQQNSALAGSRSANADCKLTSALGHLTPARHVDVTYIHRVGAAISNDSREDHQCISV